MFSQNTRRRRRRRDTLWEKGRALQGPRVPPSADPTLLSPPSLAAACRTAVVAKTNDPRTLAGNHVRVHSSPPSAHFLRFRFRFPFTDCYCVLFPHGHDALQICQRGFL